jgi:membrane protein required for colicin V production
MSIADIVLIIIILLGAYQGYKEGFLMALVSLVAILLGVLGGFKLMGYAMVLLADKFNVDDVVLPYIAFGVVFIIIVVVVSLMGRTLKASIDKNFLGTMDQAAGGLLGILKAIFMTSVILWITSSLKISPKENWIDGSFLYPKVAVFAPTVTHWIGKVIPIFKDVF